MSTTTHEEQSFEPSAWRRTRTVASMIGVLLSLALGVGLIVAMFWIGAPGDTAAQQRDEEAWQKIEELRAANAARLGSFGWVNRQQEQVHIPIERAMQLYADNPARLPEPVPEASVADTNEPTGPSDQSQPAADAGASSSEEEKERQP